MARCVGDGFRKTGLWNPTSTGERVKVKGWARFQHYKHRRPPWIKLHRDLLDDFGFSRLPLASQALAPRLWLIASDSEDGLLPDDLGELAFRLRCTVEEVRDGVNPLIDAGFLEDEWPASATLAPRKQNVTTEERRVEKSREEKLPATKQSLELPLSTLQSDSNSLDRADEVTELSIAAAKVRLERRLLALCGQIAENQDRDPPAVMLELTSYRRLDGTVAAGKVTPALLTYERLVKSVEDAEAWLADITKPAVAAP